MTANNDTINDFINTVNFCNSPGNNNSNNNACNSGNKQKCNSGMFDYNGNNNNMSSMDESLEIDSLKQQVSLLTRQRDEAIIQVS